MIELEWITTFLALGAFVGIVAGLFGVGGGGFMVPILTVVFLAQGVAVENVMHLALGTAMASIVVTSLSSTRAHNAKGAVQWGVVKGISGGILLGVFASTFLASAISSLYLAIFFSLFMACASIQMLLGKKPKPSSNISGPKELFFAGAGIGIISALVSIGGGTLTVPYLLWRNIDIKAAIGTSAAIGLPISIAGTLGYLINGLGQSSGGDYTFGHIYWPAVVFISLASFFSAPYGVKLAHYLPVAMLKKIFALLVIALSIKMLLSVI